MFFTAKTHKAECPFRVIVTETGSWQHALAGFLQHHLTKLSYHDPFLASGSKEVVEFCRARQDAVSMGFSLDVQDLFYSLPHEGLFLALRECIEENDVTSFQNACGISVGAFLDLLKTYLDSPFASLDNRLFLQKKKAYALGPAWPQC